MTRIAEINRGSLPALEPVFAMTELAMGFVPNSMLTMAHWPQLLQAFGAVAGTVLGPGGEVDPGLKQLIAFVVSNAAGCRYCQAHTSHTAERRGVDPAKIEAAFEFETSALFSEAERCALRVAARAGMVPNAVENTDMASLATHFTPRQVVEIVAVISTFGFLNRWNDTMATTLEEAPRQFGSSHLAGHGWMVGKHG